MDFFIRPMRKTDWDSVKAIYETGIESNKSTFTTVCPEYEEWDAAHLADCRLVAEAEGGIVGFAVLAATSYRAVFSGVTELSIYITPEMKRKGVGRALMEALIQESEAKNIWMLQSNVFKDNTASLGLHESCGFRVVGVREKLGKDRLGNWRDVILMERRSKVI